MWCSRSVWQSHPWGVSARCTAVLCILFYASVSQVSPADSLRLRLKQAVGDSLRCQLLSTLSETAPDGEWEQDNAALLNLAYQAFYRTSSLPQKRYYLRGMALAFNNEGLIFGRTNKAAAEALCYRLAYRLFRLAGDTSGMATALGNTGTSYLMREDLSKALSFFQQSLELSEAAHDQVGKARTLMSLGDIHRKNGHPSEALAYYEKTLAISQVLNDNWQLALALRRIASVYYNLYEYPKAAVYLRRSLAMCKKAGDQDGYAEALGILAVMELNAKQYGLAEAHLNECLRIGSAYGLSFREGETLSHLAEIELNYHHRDEKALGLMRRALEAAAGDPNLTGRVKGQMSAVFLRRQMNDSAVAYAQAALKTCLCVRSYEPALTAAGLLKTLYAGRQDYRQAFAMAGLMNQLNDSLFDTRDRLNAVRSQYRSEYLMRSATDSLLRLREKTRLEMQIGKERHNRYLLILSLAIFVMAALLGIQRYRLLQQKKVSSLRNDIANDLHDEIGASISSIKLSADYGSRAADGSERERALRNIEQTSLDIARNINDIIWSIKPGNDDVVLLFDKMQRLGREFCQHAGIAFSFRYDHIKEAPMLSYNERKHIYLIYREALHNAVKHAAAQQVQVVVSFASKIFRLIVHDNGCGFDPSRTYSGNGQESMRSRARSIGATLQIHSETGRFTEVKLEYRITRGVNQQAFKKHPASCN